MIVVPRQNTPIAKASIPDAVRAGFEQVFGRAPNRNELANLSALVAIETAAGKSVQNHNFGNITAAESYSGKAWRPPWFEVDADSSDRDLHLHQEMLKNRAPRAFRAYDSAAAGAHDFARILKVSFPEVLAAADGPGGEPFCEALAQKYSRDYANNPAAAENLRKLWIDFGGTSPFGGGGGGVGVLVLVAVLAVGAAGAAYVSTSAPRKAKATA